MSREGSEDLTLTNVQTTPAVNEGKVWGLSSGAVFLRPLSSCVTPLNLFPHLQRNNHPQTACIS